MPHRTSRPAARPASTHRALALLVASALLVALGGCATGAAGASVPLSVRDALAQAEPGEEIVISASLVTEGGVAHLCDGIQESFPPQCGAPELVLVGAPLDDLGLTDYAEERAGSVTLRVTLDGETAAYVATP